MKYYVSRDLHYFGPFDLAELKGLRAQGLIDEKTLLCSDAEKVWHFADALLDPAGFAARRIKERRFVVLKRLNKNELDFRTIGPFREPELVQGIKNKSLSGVDYVWSEGWEAWTRLARSVFASHFVVEGPEAGVDRKAMIRLTPFDLISENRWIFQEPIPPESSGADLVPKTGVLPLLGRS